MSQDVVVSCGNEAPVGNGSVFVCEGVDLRLRIGAPEGRAVTAREEAGCLEGRRVPAQGDAESEVRQPVGVGVEEEAAVPGVSPWEADLVVVEADQQVPSGAGVVDGEPGQILLAGLVVCALLIDRDDDRGKRNTGSGERHNQRSSCESPRDQAVSRSAPSAERARSFVVHLLQG
jgi:hypothetical protein